MPKQGVVKQQRVEIQTPRTKLEAMVATAPERAGGGAAVILHPYSLLGGSMHDHMVLELFRAAAQSQAFSFVIRYNQRGVGRSAGTKNLRGREDMGDVLDVVEFAAAQLPGPDKQVAVIGYSWGSCLAAYALSHPAVAAYVGVSFPLGGLSWVLSTKTHWQEVCRARHVPRLMVLGEADQFTGEAALRRGVLDSGGCLLRRDDSYLPDTDAAGAAGADAAAAAATGAAGGAATGGASSSSSASSSRGGGKGLPGAERRPLLLRVFPESDHFWLSHGSMAAEYAVGWLETLMVRQGDAAEGSAEAAEAAQEPAGAAVAEEAAAAAAGGAAAGGAGGPAGSS